MTRGKDFGVVVEYTDAMRTANEDGYRRGFIQGIQFALNSLEQRASALEIENAKTRLHLRWRTSRNRARTMAPMCVAEVSRFFGVFKFGGPLHRRSEWDNAGPEAW